MSPKLAMANEVVLIPLTGLIAYYDIRYRRIPNAIVVFVLLTGLALNGLVGGVSGFLSALLGCVIAFGLMLLLRLFGAMGAGDLKLFAAIGALIGVGLVPQTFLYVVLTGGVVAAFYMLRRRGTKRTLRRLMQVFLHPFQPKNWEPSTLLQESIPYGIAVTVGSVLSVARGFVTSQ
jgi:prepilin peptidase CpaA